MFRRSCITVLIFLTTFPPVCKAQGVPAESQERAILPGEALEIKVAGEPELSGAVVVQPDGRIMLTLLNDVHAAGLTLKQLQAELEQKLKQFVNQPRVIVVAAGMAEQRHIRVVPETPRPWLLPDLWPVR